MVHWHFRLGFSTYVANLFLNLGAVGLLPASFPCESNSLSVLCSRFSPSPTLCSPGRLTLADPGPPYRPAFKGFPQARKTHNCYPRDWKEKAREVESSRDHNKIGPQKTKSWGCSSVVESSVCMHKTLVLFPAWENRYVNQQFLAGDYTQRCYQEQKDGVFYPRPQSLTGHPLHHKMAPTCLHSRQEANGYMCICSSFHVIESFSRTPLHRLVFIPTTVSHKLCSVFRSHF